MDNLSSKIALVTGGSRGIGRQIAMSLAEAGCDIAVHYNTQQAEADSIVEAIRGTGRNAIAIGADLTDIAQTKTLVSSVTDKLGVVDIVVSNAGINPARAVEEVTDEDWERTLQINLSAAFYITQAALPGMRARNWGRLIYISSVAAQLGGVIGPHYAASKAGLIGLAHSYAAILAGEGITANVIAPALIETDMIKGNPAIKPTLIPVGRFGDPEEVSSVAVNLASNGYITGQTININGGWYMSS